MKASDYLRLPVPAAPRAITYDRMFMANDPFSSFSPSDSGILDGFETPVPPHVTGSPMQPTSRESLPPAPLPSPVDTDAPEDSLRDVPLPKGYLSRLRRLVDDL